MVEHSWKELKNKVHLLVGDLRTQEGCELLLSAHFSKVSDQREQSLLLAKIYILRGLFNLAQESLNAFFLLKGDEERFLLEQLNLYYLKGDFANWRMVISRGLTQFNIEGKFRFENLSTNEKIGILKHFEEAGFIYEVIEGYEFLKNQPLKSWEEIKIDSQLIRLFSLWKIKVPLADIYQKLLLLSKKELNLDIFLEAQHGLVLAEMVLLGAETSFDRLKNIFSLKLDVFDRKLITFDFIELFIHLEKRVPTFKLEIDQIGPLDFYEKSIMEMITSPEEELVFNMYEMSISSFFRIVAMANNLNLKVSKTVGPQCLFLMEQFSAKTKKLWISRMNLFSSTEEKLTFSFSEGILAYNGRTLSLKNQPMLLAILDFLEKAQESVSLESLALSLFAQEMDMNIQDRLRVHINRLNRLFESQLAVAKPLKIRDGFLISRLLFNKQKFKARASE